jgi:hypothetical protein
MPKAKGSKKPTSSSIFGHDSALRVLGFVADMIAIVTVLLAIKTDTVLRALPLILSPWFLYPIWILAAYTYLCWLHAYWIRTTEEYKWSRRFSVFIIGDLITKLRKPVLGFPVLLLGITLVWIARTTSTLEPIIFIVGMIGFMALVFAPMWWELFKRFLQPNDRETKNALVEQKWPEFVTLVDSKFTTKLWLTTNSFNDVSIVWGFDENTLLFAFAKYATMFPQKAYFGKIYDTPTHQLIEYNALINIQHIDFDRHYYK